MKNIFIMGDSYSTYEGFIPEGYHPYYTNDRKDAPIVRGVEKTWWRLLAKNHRLNIVINDSFSGSTVCNTVRKEHPVSVSFVNRLNKYIQENFFAENNIDTMIIFGGTNDSWTDAPIGELKYSDWNEEDLLCVLPAFCYIIDNAKKQVKNIIVVLNTNIKEEITTGFAEVCTKNRVKCLQLQDIDKENGHPTEFGMEQISEQVGRMIG